MARRNLYEINYARIEALLRRPMIELPPEGVIRLKAAGFMDLVIEVLPRCDETGATVVSMAHYCLQNGDLCQDPEMTVRLFPPGSNVFLELTPSTDPKLGRAEALMFQQAVPPIYQEVYLSREASSPTSAATSTPSWGCGCATWNSKATSPSSPTPDRSLITS